MHADLSVDGRPWMSILSSQRFKLILDFTTLKALKENGSNKYERKQPTVNLGNGEEHPASTIWF